MKQKEMVHISFWNSYCLTSLLESSGEAELDCRLAVAESQFWSSLAARPASVPLSPALLRSTSVQPAKAGALAQVASFTQTHSGGFGFHVALEEQRKHLLWRRGTSELQVYDVCVTRAGCVPVSNKACYLCCLGHSYNRGHRILSSGGNINPSMTSNLKESLSASLAHRLRTV